MKYKIKNKNCYILLFLLVLFFVALGICVFGVTKAQPVNALSNDMQQITNNNIQSIIDKNGNNRIFSDVENNKYNTLIYYFETPIESFANFYFETYVELNNSTDNDRYNKGFNKEYYAEFNVENCINYTYSRSGEPVYYIQILQPYYIESYFSNEKNANITKMNFYYERNENTNSGYELVRHYGKLVYQIKGTNEICADNAISINKFNYEIIDNINDILEKPIKEYSVNFFGYNNETLLTYTYQVENEQIVTDLSFSDMYTNALNLVNDFINLHKDYGKYQKYYFNGFDTALTDMQEFKDYSIHAKIDYCPYTEFKSTIYFYGEFNDLIYSSKYIIRDNGRDWYVASSNTLMQIYSIAEYNANALAGIDNYKLKVFKGFDVPYSENMERLKKDLNIYANFDYEKETAKINICDKDKNLIETRIVKTGIKFSDLNLVADKIYLFKFDRFYSFSLNNQNGGSIAIYSDNIIFKDLDIYPSYEYIGVEIKIYNADIYINSIFKEIGEIITENDLDLKNIDTGFKVGYKFDKWTRTDYYRKHLDANQKQVNVDNIYSIINTDVVEIHICPIFLPYKIETNNWFELIYKSFLEPTLIIIASIFVIIIIILIIRKIIFK